MAGHTFHPLLLHHSFGNITHDHHIDKTNTQTQLRYMCGHDKKRTQMFDQLHTDT